MTNDGAGQDDLFLPQRFSWMNRAMFSGLPTQPKTGDLGPVRDALTEIVDAAGGLEHTRHQVGRAMTVAQDEFDAARKSQPDFPHPDSWGGRNTPVVYYEFCSAVAWTRAVKDRYMDRLHPSVKHDSALWTTLQRVRSRADAQFEDARLLAQCVLHKYTPPYPLAGPKVGEGGILIYRVPRITDPDDFRANLSSLADDRHVASLVDEWWLAIAQFVDGLLDVFYPNETVN
jgi:hypothetical protein